MYKIEKLNKFVNLFHCFSTIDDGNMALVVDRKNVPEEQVLKNRKKFFKNIEVDINSAMSIWLEHGDKVILADEKWKGETLINKTTPPRADAVITNKKELCLCLTIADCVPIILFDPVNQAIGLVHAGWKGTDKKIVTKVIKRLSELYGTNSSDLIVGIGPSVRKKSYIKEDPEQKNDPKWEGFVEQVSEDKYSIDVVGYNKQQLIDSGLKDSNIIDSGIDTAKDPRFFSHSNNTVINNEGRFLCIASLN